LVDWHRRRRPATPEHVDAAITHHAQEPGFQGPFTGIVGPWPAQRSFEGIVYGVLGIVRVAENLNCQGVCTTAELSQFASHIVISAWFR
jgi:hypothetical protein